MKSIVRPSVVGLFLTASLAATLSTSVFADGSWEILTVADGLSPANVTGVDGVVWVPNQFSTPAIDANGKVTFRSQIAGPGITATGATANHVVLVTGTGAPWTVVARNNSAVPGNLPAGAIISRTASPNNSIASSNNISSNGGIVVSGFMTGPTIVNSGATTQNDTAMWFMPPSGAPVLLAQRLDACPGTAGAQYSASPMNAGSGQRTNNAGESLFYTALVGGDTVTANNAAIVLLNGGSDVLVSRKGEAAPGYKGLTLNPDSFGQFLNGSTYAFSAKLVGTGITTANDSVYCTNAFATGSYRIFAREGDPIPGFDGLTIANTSSLSFGQRPVSTDGTMTFIATLGGAVTSVDNGAVMTERNGVFSILIRKGQAIPGITDSTDPNFAGKVFQSPNTTGFVRTASGMLAFEGIFMNPDGTGISSPAPATFIGVRKTDGTLVTVCRQGDAVPGLKGWVFNSLNGSTSICASDNGCVVFAANINNGVDNGTALMAWDAVGGLRLLAKAGTTIGDTNFTGTAINQISLAGSTASNGDGGGTCLTDTGWLVVRANDTASALYAIARIRVESSGAACPADLDGDGDVGASDLAALLSAWGTANADLDGDGDTGASDIAIVLSSWGACP